MMHGVSEDPRNGLLETIGVEPEDSESNFEGGLVTISIFLLLPPHTHTHTKVYHDSLSLLIYIPPSPPSYLSLYTNGLVELFSTCSLLFQRARWQLQKILDDMVTLMNSVRALQRSDSWPLLRHPPPNRSMVIATTLLLTMVARL